jgi:FMN reductase
VTDPAPPAERSLVVVSAGLGQPSSTRLLADRLTAAVTDRLRSHGVAARSEVVELREFAQDLTNNLLTGFPSPRLKDTIERVVASDGLIAVSPIFSASYSGLFKLFFDVLERDALAGKPVLIAATAGSARHSLALEHAFRPLFAYLNAAVVPTAVFAAAEDWGERDSGGDLGLTDRIERAAGELAAAVAARTPSQPGDPFADPTPFEELLRSSAPPRRP